VDRRRVRGDVGLQRQVSTGQHHGHAVGGDRSRDDDLVAGANQVSAQHAALRDQADAGGVDEDAVGCAAGHDLGVTGHDAHAHGRGRVPHPVGKDLQPVDAEALLDHERGGEP
jgi:hypothetical protein